MTDDDVPPAAQAEIAAAVRLALARHGYAGLTTSKIAAAYDKSESGLYYYYDSKDDMIAAFLDHAAAEFAADLPAADDADPETRLRAVCESLFLSPDDEDANVHVGVMELLSHAQHNETLRAPLRRLETTALDTISDIVCDGIDQGVFRPVDPQATAAFLLAAADGSTGFHVALELDVGDDLRTGWSAYVDGLLADQPDTDCDPPGRVRGRRGSGGHERGPEG